MAARIQSNAERAIWETSLRKGRVDRKPVHGDSFVTRVDCGRRHILAKSRQFVTSESIYHGRYILFAP
jgi:hypothetical protein